MKKVYECSLLQVTSEQGYIVSGNGDKDLTTKDTRILYDPSDITEKYAKQESDVYFGQIMVTKTPNKYFVREIRTGKVIPLVQGTEKLQLEEGKQRKHSFPFGKIHTYVSNIKYVDSYIGHPIYSGLEEVYDPSKVEEYLNEHLNKENYLLKIEAFFTQGQNKMQRKLELDACTKEIEKEDQNKIKRLLKKNSVQK